MSSGVGGRRGSEPVLLWLWSRLAATAPIRPLAWKPPYATRAAQEMAKRPKKKKKKSFHLSQLAVLQSCPSQPFGKLNSSSQCCQWSPSRQVWLSGWYWCTAMAGPLAWVSFFFFFAPCSMWKFPGQWLNLSHSSDNTRSLTARPPGNSNQCSLKLHHFLCIWYHLNIKILKIQKRKEKHDAARFHEAFSKY